MQNGIESDVRELGGMGRIFLLDSPGFGWKILR